MHPHEPLVHIQLLRAFSSLVCLSLLAVTRVSVSIDSNQRKRAQSCFAVYHVIHLLVRIKVMLLQQ